MKQTTTFGLFAFALLWCLLTATTRDPNNPPTGRTGAPNETTCETAGCHNGGTFTGTVTLSGLPDTVFPNQSYTITLTQASNAARAGFQVTCLDANNTKCGNFSAATGCSIANASGRQYIRQSSAKTLSNGSVSWTFPWQAPAMANGNQVVFYYASLAANNNNNRNGDNALAGTKTLYLQSSPVPTHQAETADWMRLYPTIVTDFLHLELLQATSGQLEIYDQQGQRVHTAPLSALNTIPLTQLPAGLYLARVQAAGQQSAVRFVRL